MNGGKGGEVKRWVRRGKEKGMFVVVPTAETRQTLLNLTSVQLRVTS